MKKAFYTAYLTTVLYALPVVVFAQGQDLAPIKRLVRAVGEILNMLIPVLIAAAVVVFFFGLVKYIWGSGKGHEQGRKVMIAGIVALFIMVSVWGIVRLVQNALGVTPDQIGNTPSVPLR